ncbi:hypothetical protein Tco_0089374 [Tanacetum coccineum]
MQTNRNLEERLDKHGSRLYALEQLDIPHKKSLECDHLDQLASDLKEARLKKRKKGATPRTPSGSPLSQPLPLPPPAGGSGATGTSGASGSSQFPPPLPHPSTARESFPTESMLQDDSILDEHVNLSDDEDFENNHSPNAASRKDWWKPLPEEDRPVTPEPTWIIPSSNTSDVENNWAAALASTYAYEVVKPFYPDVIHLQFQMEECHKLLIDQVDWTNLKGNQVRINVNRPLPLGGPLGHLTIQTQFFFNKDLEYLRYGIKGSCPALSISKMKAARYLDFGLELLVPEQMWIDEVCSYDISAKYGITYWWFTRQKFYIDRHDAPSRQKEVRSKMRILSVIKIKAYSRYGYDYLSEIILRRADHQEHIIAKKDFKNLYPSDFKDLNILLLEGHLDHLPGYEFKHDYTIIESPRAVVFQVKAKEQKITRFTEIYKFSDGTLTRILEALDYRVKEFKVKRLNPGMNTRFWTKKDVTRAKSSWRPLKGD